MPKFVNSSRGRWFNVDHVTFITEPSSDGVKWEVQLCSIESPETCCEKFDNKDAAWSFFEGVTGYGEEDAG